MISKSSDEGLVSPSEMVPESRLAIYQLADHGLREIFSMLNGFRQLGWAISDGPDETIPRLARIPKAGKRRRDVGRRP
jgi:hypothetical protein